MKEDGGANGVDADRNGLKRAGKGSGGKAQNSLRKTGC